MSYNSIGTLSWSSNRNYKFDDHQATRLESLKTHIQSVHEKIKYSCNQCDHQATTQSNLKKHIQSMHDKIRKVK